jgi:exodeoxyribonuclease-5
VIPTPGQAAVLKAVQNLQKSHPNGGGVVQVVGYAGTGKSWSLQLLDQEFDGIKVLTPTGKAALRCRELELNAQTIHSFLYRPEEDQQTGEVKFILKMAEDVVDVNGGFLVVDEASMVTQSVYLDLYRFCRNVNLNLVLVGDGFQLAPVEKDKDKQGFCCLDMDIPHQYRVELTEIVRQAMDNPIIRISMAVRTQKFPDEALAQLPIVRVKDLEAEAAATWSNGGVVICHRNITRHNLNSSVRKLLGRPKTQLVAGEPLMITQNNRVLDLYNGEVANVLTKPEVLNRGPLAVLDRYSNASAYVDFLALDLQGSYKRVVVADREVFGTLGAVGGSALRYASRKLLDTRWERDDQGRPEFVQANLGYAITCHKSQGSEWNDVLVCIEPSIRLYEEEGRRWTYTALTRAKNRVRICWM